MRCNDTALHTLNFTLAPLASFSTAGRVAILARASLPWWMRRSVVVVDSMTNAANLACPSLMSWRAVVRRSAILATVQSADEIEAAGFESPVGPRGVEDADGQDGSACCELTAVTPMPDRRAMEDSAAPENEEPLALRVLVEERFRGGGLMGRAWWELLCDLQLLGDSALDESWEARGGGVCRSRGRS